MPTAQKAQTIEEARDWFSRSKGVIFTDYRGLKVKQMQVLRNELAKKGGEIHVIKNTLFRLAAGDDASKLPDDLHNGPTAVAFLFENERRSFLQCRKHTAADVIAVEQISFQAGDLLVLFVDPHHAGGFAEKLEHALCILEIKSWVRFEVEHDHITAAKPFASRI